jgi:plasmid stabilization system protein ParE
MNQIVWSDLAYLTYTDISEYLIKQYSLDAAIRFDEEVESLLDKLRSFDRFCPSYEKRPVLRKCVINRYSSLLYRVDGNKIQLASFFDNRGLHVF